MDLKLLLFGIYFVIWIDLPLVESAYRPVYVPYIFQLFGDRPATNTNTKTEQTDKRTDTNTDKDNVFKEGTGELANLRLKGTGKKIHYENLPMQYTEIF